MSEMVVTIDNDALNVKNLLEDLPSSLEKMIDAAPQAIPTLDFVLEEIAKSGKISHPWVQVKNLFRMKIFQVSEALPSFKQ